MTRAEIKAFMRDNNVKLWQVAKYLDLDYLYLSGLLKYDPDKELEEKIVKVVRALSHERT